MGFLNLFKSGGKKAVVEGEKGLIMLLEKMGFDGVVDEAQISQYEDALDKVSKLAAKAKETYDIEQKQFITVRDHFNEVVGDYEKIKTAIESGEKSGEPWESHARALAQELTETQSDLEREEQEANDALEHYNLLKETLETKASQLIKVREALKQARRENQNLDIQQERIKEREQQQKEIMGIREATNSVDSILNAIKSDSSKKRQEIEAAKMRLDALKSNEKVRPESSIDPDVAAFLGKDKNAAVNKPGSPLPTFTRK